MPGSRKRLRLSSPTRAAPPPAGAAGTLGALWGRGEPADKLHGHHGPFLDLVYDLVEGRLRSGCTAPLAWLEGQLCGMLAQAVEHWAQQEVMVVRDGAVLGLATTRGPVGEGAPAGKFGKIAFRKAAPANPSDIVQAATPQAAAADPTTAAATLEPRYGTAASSPSSRGRRQLRVAAGQAVTDPPAAKVPEAAAADPAAGAAPELGRVDAACSSRGGGGLWQPRAAAGQQASAGAPVAVDLAADSDEAPLQAKGSAAGGRSAGPASGPTPGATAGGPVATPAAAQAAGGSPRTLRCPLMTAAEAEPITVPLAHVVARLRPTLEQHGVAVVTGVAGEEELARLQALFAQDLAGLVDQEAAKAFGGAVQTAAASAGSNAQDWPLGSLALLGPMERCASRALPHGQFAWEARRLPGVRRAYEVLHGTADLVSSCDNSFFAPSTHRRQASNRSLPHVDHNEHDVRFKDSHGGSLKHWEVYQGLLYVWGSTTEHASATVVWPDSHKAAYDSIMADAKVQRNGRQGRHFTLVDSMTAGEPQARLREGWRAGARRVPVPAGALLLWSSRTMHQGWRGGPRLAQPVCWEPTARRSDMAFERKLRMAALGLPSTHWASLGLPHMLVGNPEPCAPTAPSVGKGGVCLPLCASIRPCTLMDSVEVGQMWELCKGVAWMDPLPPAVRKRLEESVRSDFKALL